ncbi:g4754 [Coccomyxa elongata]
MEEQANGRTGLCHEAPAYPHNSVVIEPLEIAEGVSPPPVSPTKLRSLVRSASNAAINVSAAAIGTPVSLMLSAAALTSAPADLVRSASSYVPEPRALVGAVLGWAPWAPLPVRTVRKKTKTGKEESIRLEVKLLNGADLVLELPAEVTLAESREQVARSLGLPLRRQFFVVAEDRARGAGLSSLAGSVSRHLAAPRDLRGTLISWVNFIFLPEAVNRELYGRGLIGSLKATTWWQQLQEKQNKAAQQSAPLKDGVRVQVETLAGKVMAVDVDANASLAAMRAGIYQAVGIAAKQQRLIILERTGPGVVTHLTNTMLLHSLAGARTLMGAASWASSTLIGALKEDTRFPVDVRTHCGACLTLSVTGDTTVDQLREMVEARIGSKKKPAQSPPGGGGETPRSMATPSNGSTQGGSPLKKAAAGATAERAVVAVAAAAAEKAAPTITLAEIGLPEAMPARQPLAQQFVRVVNI